jgi:hypothetical protein
LPPAYTDPTVTYSSISVAINSFYDVLIPQNYDPEGGLVTILLSDTYSATVNYIIAADKSKVTFSPIAFGEVGLHSVKIILEDPQGLQL